MKLDRFEAVRLAQRRQLLHSGIHHNGDTESLPDQGSYPGTILLKGNKPTRTTERS